MSIVTIGKSADLQPTEFGLFNSNQQIRTKTLSSLPKLLFIPIKLFKIKLGIGALVEIFAAPVGALYLFLSFVLSSFSIYIAVTIFIMVFLACLVNGSVPQIQFDVRWPGSVGLGTKYQNTRKLMPRISFLGSNISFLNPQFLAVLNLWLVCIIIFWQFSSTLCVSLYVDILSYGLSPFIVSYHQQTNFTLNKQDISLPIWFVREVNALMTWNEDGRTWFFSCVTYMHIACSYFFSRVKRCARFFVMYLLWTGLFRIIYLFNRCSVWAKFLSLELWLAFICHPQVINSLAWS